jgi:hypothetical protein
VRRKTFFPAAITRKPHAPAAAPYPYVFASHYSCNIAYCCCAQFNEEPDLRNQLKNLLGELHAELKHAEAMDEKSRAELVKLAREIEESVGDPADVSADSAPHESKLGLAVLEFEADYPRVSGILGQIADTLSKMGI